MGGGSNFPDDELPPLQRLLIEIGTEENQESLKVLSHDNPGIPPSLHEQLSDKEACSSAPEVSHESSCPETSSSTASQLDKKSVTHKDASFKKEEKASDPQLQSNATSEPIPIPRARLGRIYSKPLWAYVFCESCSVRQAQDSSDKPPSLCSTEWCTNYRIISSNQIHEPSTTSNGAQLSESATKDLGMKSSAHLAANGKTFCRHVRLAVHEYPSNDPVSRLPFMKYDFIDVSFQSSCSHNGEFIHKAHDYHLEPIARFGTVNGFLPSHAISTGRDLFPLHTGPIGLGNEALQTQGSSNGSGATEYDRTTSDHISNINPIHTSSDRPSLPSMGRLKKPHGIGVLFRNDLNKAQGMIGRSDVGNDLRLESGEPSNTVTSPDEEFMMMGAAHYTYTAQLATARASQMYF